MGQRSGTETVIAILQAFLTRRRWSQAALAREVGVSAPALRRRLLELEAQGFPLTTETDHPHVYWSLPRQWFPGGVVLTAEECQTLVRLLVRQSRSAERTRLLTKLLGASAPAANLERAIVAPAAHPSEDRHLPTLEDAAARREALRMRYFSAHRGQLEERHASVHRVVVGPPARFIAVCHRADALRWFRVDNVVDARLDASVAYRRAEDADIEHMLATSVDGFAGGSAAPVRFFVRDPESRWVRNNLPAPMEVEVVPGGIEVSAHTAGLVPLARFVAGLGGAARGLSPELTAAVRALAQATLDACEAPADGASRA